MTTFLTIDSGWFLLLWLHFFVVLRISDIWLKTYIPHWFFNTFTFFKWDKVWMVLIHFFVFCLNLQILKNKTWCSLKLFKWEVQKTTQWNCFGICYSIFCTFVTEELHVFHFCCNVCPWIYNIYIFVLYKDVSYKGFS